MELTENRLIESGARTDYKPLTLDEIKYILEIQEKAQLMDSWSKHTNILEIALPLKQEIKRLEFVIEQGLKLCKTYEDTIEKQNYKLEKIPSILKQIKEHEELVGTIPEWLKTALKEILENK